MIIWFGLGALVAGMVLGYMLRVAYEGTSLVSHVPEFAEAESLPDGLEVWDEDGVTVFVTTEEERSILREKLLEQLEREQGDAEQADDRRVEEAIG